MRKAIYTKSKTHRIISYPNGLWVCQNEVPAIKQHERPADPWVNLHRPTHKAEAMRQLAIYGEIDQ